MIVTTGKSIKIDVGTCGLQIERSCETPGKVSVANGKGGWIDLPANPDEAAMFIASYRRAIAEDIPYRDMKSEDWRAKGAGDALQSESVEP